MLRLALVVLVALSACTVTDIPPPVYLFEGQATVEVPDVVRVGEPFAVTVEARSRVDGTGFVALRSGVEQLRVIEPLRDTVRFGVGIRAVTDSVRVRLAAGERVRQRWVVVVEDLPDVALLTAHLGAYVQLDSVRLDDGRLVAIDSEDGWQAFSPGSIEGIDTSARTGDISIRLVR